MIGGISGNIGEKCSLYYSVNAGKIEGQSYIGEIYGVKYGYVGNNQSYSDTSTMPDIISITKGENIFIEDVEGINDGYPILAWQVQETD